MTSPSGSLASDLFWPEIWGDLVKISGREQRTEREQIFFFKYSTGKCENVGENFGIANMDECDCPYDNSCTWKNDLNNDILDSIDVTYENYNLRISGISFAAGGAGPGTEHLSSAVSFIF